jgi:hypothetical protein
MKLGPSRAFAGFRAKTFKAKTFVLPLALGVGALLAFQADAQQSPQPAANPPAAPESAAPAPGPDAQPQTPRWRDGGRGGWNRGGRQDGPQAGISDQDRGAFFSARLAAIKAGLLLTPDQEKLWPPAEAAVRDMVRQRAEAREQFRKEGRPSNPIDALRKMGEAQAARGETMKKMADAVGPLYSSLSDDQKRRLRFLTRGFGRMGMAGDRGGDRRMGPGMGPGGERGGRDWGRDRDMRRGPDGDGQRGFGPRWRQGMNGGFNQDSDNGESRGLDRNPGTDRSFGRNQSFDRNNGFDRGNGIEDWRNGL